jgi:iron complex outermembrane recepter protein
MTMITVAPLATRSLSNINGLGRSAFAALLLCGVATPALAQTQPAPTQAPAPSSTNTGQVEQTTQQSPSNAPAAPQTTDVTSPQSGTAVTENSPQGPQEQQASKTGLSDIVVTATKRETNLQRTPIALSVANTQALTDRHAKSLLDLADGSIPSLRVATFEARQSALTVGIRGIVPFDQNQTARDTPIGVYVDGVYLGRSQGLNASLLDIDRIEVLRGPQGTLFGRNTEGGALSIVTKAPSGKFDVRGTGGVGNYGSYDGEIHLDLPSFYNFAIKLDGLIQHQDATVKNPLAGQYGWNYHNTVGGRASGRWTPVDGLTVDLVYDYTKDQNTPNYSQLINYNPNGFNVGTYTNPTTGLVGTTLFFNGVACNTTTNPCIRPLSPLVVVSGDHRQHTAEIGVPQQPSVDKTHGFSGTIKYKLLDNLELRSITAWRGVSTRQWDNSGGAHRTTFAPNTLFSRYSLSELFQNQFSQEFQAVGSFTNLDYVLGAYYFNEHAEEAAATPSTNRWNVDGTSYTIVSEDGNGVPQPPYNCSNPSVPAPPATPTQPPQGWDRQFWCVQRHSTAKAKSYGAFGQATWTPLPPLHITVGARYTHDKRDGVLDVVNGNPINVGGVLTWPGPAVLPNPFTFHFSKSRVDPLAILAFDASNSIHLYAKYSTGYRAGGANDRSATFRAFGPEKVQAWELGAKTDFWEHRARLNLAAYYMRRTGTQTDFDNVDTNPASPTFNLHTEETINAPGVSKIKGIEADLTVRPIDSLTLGASYAYTDVKIPPTPNPFIAGNPLFQVFPVYTPKNAASGFADFEVPAGIGNGKWRLHLDANYAGKQYSFQAENVKTDSSFIVNGRLALADVEMNMGSTLMTFSVWSRNLLNETHIYRRSAANSVPAPVFNSAGVPTGALNYGGVLGDYGNFNPPRTFGAEIAFKIGAPRIPVAEPAPLPPPPPPATVTCESGAVVTAPGVCPQPPAPPPPPPPVTQGERGD